MEKYKVCCHFRFKPSKENIVLDTRPQPGQTNINQKKSKTNSCNRIT